MLTQECLQDAVKYGECFIKFGKTAEYIPELARVNKYHLGACIVGLDGTVTVSYTHLDVYKRQSHGFVSKEAIKFGNLPADAKVIVCHIGNGASVSASIGGKCVDTSMGLTPLEGLIMGTRSGDLDPAVIQYICNKENKSVDEVLNMLNKKSGLLGMSGGLSSDCRDITKAAEEGHHLAKVTLDAYTYRIAKYVGAYAAAMNGVDAIAFTAGVRCV